ncbi:MAG: hypothetical protein BLM47_14115 [Candidatus Reconcilbacillus cellulovorans]|uniref:Uncharacterized protein n=1 Tax=Candidatus Reconcilbacillus cellulovorans TaxID=1906605 RepID=A0A2A6DWA6_9BACL|nr:MAG: hypothetical protein BLM47_14115 [Candidatus Reconcilbacillus cellulovorans]
MIRIIGKLIPYVSLMVILIGGFIWIRSYYYNRTFSGILESHDIRPQDVKLSLETSYATYYLYERKRDDGLADIGILSIQSASQPIAEIRSGYKLANQFENTFDSTRKVQHVQAFGRTLVMPGMHSFLITGGVVRDTTPETKIRIKSPSTYFLHNLGVYIENSDFEIDANRLEVVYE